MGESVEISRRNFLRGSHKPGGGRVSPPGATTESLEACTGCGRCVDACPAHIIRLIADRPALDFSVAECTFCGQCAELCPEPVFIGRPRHFPHVAMIGESCLAKNRTDCQACRDACPTEAIRFRPRAGGPFLPELNEEACTGCGACFSVCPVAAIRTRETDWERADV
ncbi:4Fe-4S dicluster domain-containing protein [Sinorhizobium medicae]|uniref:Ferredoxin-type protein NapF n=1 Tax=Sinorhizobium medicae (strain WSM419) TaxID=366394 RepID=A6UJX5_SINMW|nr:ferredoxin-type protein NapF [Sinorhizobium medicae]ABR63955.1 ferredoxin-type protein NapF [Sinorhizobium medicae WSM419]MDX0424162.1 4Fe-4S dicluster domain-containing protein [Sinorhizobium medicae]MDX0430955.1 4Fe-4S dicluster domain-containing protein [Sinorhizobium medicae]MDX0435296.1 4Fe-4S dicluster domain-containing protein [Sinorhizobium medicae]MDX0453466.1 4Fe-4S dicluster domain-containing protein [Sinorhizobium medicae]